MRDFNLSTWSKRSPIARICGNAHLPYEGLVTKSHPIGWLFYLPTALAAIYNQNGRYQRRAERNKWAIIRVWLASPKQLQTSLLQRTFLIITTASHSFCPSDWGIAIELTFFMTQTQLKPTFGGHETFPFRYGWLKKGMDATDKTPNIFSQDHALVELGVGKNMVRSIRHWCLAMNLMQEGESNRQLEATPLGQKFLLENGWDPFIEDIGSHWLLHWELVANTHRALFWHYLFAHYYEAEFTKEQFNAFCTRKLESANIQTTEKMIVREVECCLRTHVARPSKSISSEDSLDCPLAELNLLRYNDEDKVYSFNGGDKPTLPIEVFGYALFHFLADFASTRRTVAVDDCLYQPASPGQVFRLNENSLVMYLEELEELTDGQLRLQESSGLRQLYLGEGVVENASALGFRLLDKYYGE